MMCSLSRGPPHRGSERLPVEINERSPGGRWGPSGRRADIIYTALTTPFLLVMEAFLEAGVLFQWRQEMFMRWLSTPVT